MASDLRTQGAILFKQRSYLGALLAIFLIHSALTALFLFLPQWIQQHGFTDRHSWHFYLPVFLIGFSGAMQIIRWTEKKRAAEKNIAALFVVRRIDAFVAGNRA